MSDDVDRLRRWVDAGGTFKVLSRTTAAVVVALLTCDAGEEVDRFRSIDPVLLGYVDGRETQPPAGALPPEAGLPDDA